MTAVGVTQLTLTMFNTSTNALLKLTPITITNVDTTAAILYTDITGTALLGSNVVNTDSNGNLTIFAIAAGKDGTGRYILTPTGLGAQTFQVPTSTRGGVFYGDVNWRSGIPWVDVKAFGALGDGSTNDTAAIMAAHNSLPLWAGSVATENGNQVRNGILHFGRGVYIVSPLLLSPAVEFVGDGGQDNTVIKLANGSAPSAASEKFLITIDRALSGGVPSGAFSQGVKFTNLSLDANAANNPGSSIMQAYGGVVFEFDNVIGYMGSLRGIVCGNRSIPGGDCAQLFVTSLDIVNAAGSTPRGPALQLDSVQAGHIGMLSLGGANATGSSTNVDARTITDGVTTNATATLTSATAAFTDGDVGSRVNNANFPAGTYITNLTSGSVAVTSAVATASGSSLTVTIGANSNAALYLNGCSGLTFGAIFVENSWQGIDIKDCSDITIGHGRSRKYSSAAQPTAFGIRGAAARVSLPSLFAENSVTLLNDTSTPDGGITNHGVIVPGASGPGHTAATTYIQDFVAFKATIQAGQIAELIIASVGSQARVNLQRGGAQDWLLVAYTDNTFTFFDKATNNPLKILRVADITSGGTALTLMCNQGGTLRFQRVGIGAANSGGSGLAALVVPN